MTGDLSTAAETPENGWSKVYLVGGIAGLVIGLLSAYLFARAAQEKGEVQPSSIKTMDALKLSVALLSIVRQITDLGASGSKD
jgi:hypothetical protein